MSKLPDIGLTYIVGEQPEQFRVEPDPERLSLFGITLQQLAAKVEGANRSFRVGAVREDGSQLPVVAGQTLQSLPEIGHLLLTARDGRPVYVRDVADVALATAPAENRVTDIRRTDDGLERAAAVSLAIAKRPGTNAVVIAEEIVHRLEEVRGQSFPEDVEMTITRNYGETANEKANELLFHLGLATISIVVLVAIAIGCARRGGRHRHSDDHSANLLCLMDHGLYHQPRLAVRVDLLDRHSGRRCHRCH